MDSIRKLFCFLALVCLLPHHAQCQGETIEGVNDFNLVISDQRVPLGEIGNLTISVNYTGALRELNYDLRLKFYQPENDEKASYIVLEEDNLYFSSHCIMHGTLKNITVRGVYLGFSTILVRLWNGNTAKIAYYQCHVKITGKCHKNSKARRTQAFL